MTRNLLIISCFFILWLGGCGTDSDPGAPDFGSDYSVVLAGGSPSITGNSLSVILFYLGCEPNHEFVLNFEETGDNEFEIWLTKITPNQDCQESFEESRIFPLPAGLETGRIVFNAPNIQRVLREF